MATPIIATPSIDRVAINRANAEHSTGPRTAEGKERMRLNATKHGMYSQQVVLPGEDRAAYENLGAQLTQTYNPLTEEARALVQLLQDIEWRLNRITALEFNLHALGTVEQLDSIDPAYAPAIREALAQAAAYRANQKTFDQLSRHEGRLRRLYAQTVAQLRILPVQPKPQTGFVPNVVAIAPPQAPTQPEPAPSPSPKLPKMPKFSGPMKNVHRKQWLRKHDLTEVNGVLQPKA